MVILITAASGRTSGYVLAALLASGAVTPADLRLFVRSEDAVKKLQAAHPSLPRTSFALGDFTELSTVTAAMAGVDAVFHNAPAFHPNETAIGITVVEEAKKAGVKHFVYCSVFHSLVSKLLNHDVKRR